MERKETQKGIRKGGKSTGGRGLLLKSHKLLSAWAESKKKKKKENRVREREKSMEEEPSERVSSSGVNGARRERQAIRKT